MTELPTLYKVIIPDGSPCHGGNPSFRWPLPVMQEDGSFEPGAWAEVDGEIVICERGLHLTSEPARWWLPDAQCYVAEYAADEQPLHEGGDKYCGSRARLLRPSNWAEVAVWSEGEHEITNGYCRARGSAHVVAGNSAHVVARDSAHVVAWDSAYVVARGSAHVVAWGSAHVVSTQRHSEFAIVALHQMAAHIDRRQGKLIMRSARQEHEMEVEE